MRIPTIHLNGTSRESLLDALGTAGSALYAALKALDECAPNGRDYYPQGPTALTEALTEHADRCAHVRAALHEIRAMAEIIETGKD